MNVTAESVNCFRCGRKLEKVMPELLDSIQPHQGIVCSSRGNYGSRVFDPSFSTEDTLIFVICDECVKENIGSLWVCTPIRRKTEYTLEQVNDWNDLP